MWVPRPVGGPRSYKSVPICQRILAHLHIILATQASMTRDPIVPKTTWSQYLSQIYTIGQPPIIGSYDYRVVEEKARESMKDNLGTRPHSQTYSSLIEGRKH